MTSLTPRQRDLLTFLRVWPHPWSPSYREMAAGIGNASGSDIGRWLTGLEGLGYIRRLHAPGGYGRPRGIEVVRPAVTINGQRFLFIPKTMAA